MSITVDQVAYVGQTLTLRADTKYAALAATTNRQICYQQKGRSIIPLSAEIVSGQPTKLEATIASENMDLKANIRAWTKARGEGTIVFIGEARIIRVLAEGETP